MAIIAYTNTQVGALGNLSDTAVVRLRLPVLNVDLGRSGKYVVFGRVVIGNGDDGSAQGASVRLTTRDGQTELDRADVRIDTQVEGNSASISLQATMDLSMREITDVVDIRCGGFKCVASEASLLAISVDDLVIGGV